MRFKILAALFAASLWCGMARAQDYVQSYTFVIPTIGGPGGATNFANTGVNSFAIFWSPATTVSSCAVQVDSSSDGVSYGNGDLIASQNCKVAGSTPAAALAAGKTYVRVNLTVLTGNGGVNVTIKGWGGASGGGTVGPGTPTSVACFSTTTNTGNCPSGATDSGSIFTIPEQVLMGSGAGAASVSYPSGNPATCLTPTAGQNILCSDGTLNQLTLSLNGAAYVPISTSTGGGIPCSALPALTGDTTTSAGNCGTTTGKINGTVFAGTSGNFAAFGAGNTPADSGVAVNSLAPAPATQASVAGKNLCGYNESTGAWTLCNLAPFSPQTPAADTLTNATLTSEQFFATNPAIPANTFTTGTEYTFNAGFDYTGTGTPATGTLRVRLCSVGLPTPSACVIIFQSTAVAPGVNTRNNWVSVHVLGTTTPGSSVSIVAYGGNGQSTTIWGNNVANSGSSIVTGVHTSAQLFLVFSIQYANTTASSSAQLTGVWANPGPII